MYSPDPAWAAVMALPMRPLAARALMQSGTVLLPQVYGAVTDNWPTIEPYFNETGACTWLHDQVGLPPLYLATLRCCDKAGWAWH